MEGPLGKLQLGSEVVVTLEDGESHEGEVFTFDRATETIVLRT